MLCQICKGEKLKPLFKKENLKLNKCLNCGLVQVDDLLSIFDAKHYEYYRNKTNLTEEELYNSITTKRYISLLNRLESYRKNGTILDIGCGVGHFLSVARKMKWETKGIEIADYAVEICKKFKIDIEQSDLLKLDLKEGYYDIVTMFEVLEHLTNPRDYLVRVNNILRKGGILIITTPNFNSITRLILQNRWSLIHKEHLLYFTPKSIKWLMRYADFRIIEFKIKHITLPELLRISSISSYNNHICNQKFRNVIEENMVLSFLKYMTNKFLDITKMGESIECICQKI